MRESRKGNPPKTFGQCGSSWLGWVLLVAEEILQSKCLCEMHLWMEGSPLSLISDWLSCRTPVPSYRRVLPCWHVFAIGACDDTSECETGRSQTHTLNWRGDALTLWCEMALWAPPIPLPTYPLGSSWCQECCCPMRSCVFAPCCRVTGVVMAFIRRWDRVFLRESGKILKIIQVQHVALHKLHPWQSQPSREWAWLDMQGCCKEGERKINWDRVFRASSHVMFHIGFITF